MKKLSIVVPVYNAEEYLKECLDSIVAELKDIDELILVNDGSTDKSKEICCAYLRDNIHVIHNSNHGVSYTRNCGIKVAKGDYITFVDSDDYLYSGWRTTLEKGMETNKDVIMFSETSDYQPTKKELLKSILFLPQEKRLAIKAGACWGKLFNRKYLIKNSIEFDCEIINGEDGLFCLESVLNTTDYLVVRAPDFYFYRPNNSSATHRFSEKYNSSNFNYIKSVEMQLRKSDLFEEEEIKESVNLINVTGLYILAVRIATIKNKIEREKIYILFEQPQYIELYNRYVPNKECSSSVRRTFKLLSKGKYSVAIRNIIVRRKIFNIIKRIVRR